MNVSPTDCWISFSSICICLAELEVERAERLVQEQDLRPVDERASERDPLALPAGELRRSCVRRTPESCTMRERLVHPSRRSSFGTRLTFRPYSTFSPTVMCGNSA